MPQRSAEKRRLFRELLRPGSDNVVWPHSREVGWAKVPRYLGVALAAIRTCSTKGIDPSGTYVELLARNFGEGLVEIINEAEHALLSGLSPTSRGVRSWRERLGELEQLGFIEQFPKGGPRLSHVILLHPRRAIKDLREKGLLHEDLWLVFERQLIDYGSSAAEVPTESAKPVDGATS